MKAFTNPIQHTTTVVAGLMTIVLICFFTVGCSESSTGSNQPRFSKRIPKLKFHQPPNYSAAVARLREIHDAVMADAPLPDPKQLEILEVIHGSGASAHSHFHLATEDVEDHDYGPGHDHLESAEKIHEIEIDIFTELLDIARWLPDIAAKGAMPEGSWNRVKAISGQLSTEIDQLLGDQQAKAQKRTALQQESKKIDGLLTELETVNENGENP